MKQMKGDMMKKDMPVKDALADKYAGSFIDTAIFS